MYYSSVTLSLRPSSAINQDYLLCLVLNGNGSASLSAFPVYRYVHGVNGVETFSGHAKPDVRYRHVIQYDANRALSSCCEV
jgi:hypothetical protein